MGYLPPAVFGKLLDEVAPVTYTLPLFATFIPEPASFPLPPKNLDHLKFCRLGVIEKITASDCPPEVPAPGKEDPPEVVITKILSFGSTTISPRA